MAGVKDLSIELQEFLSGEHRDDYSGRGMFGKICDAWEYDDDREAVLDMMMALSAAGEDTAALLKVFKGYVIDNMGRGVVLYFPRLGKREEIDAVQHQ
jgi:hypothetical protein